MTINDRLLDFAVRTIHLSQHLRSKHKEYCLSNQVLRSGTSIGANFEEACGSITKADYIAKLSISLKEARETLYWIKLFRKAELLDEKLYQSLYNDCNTIIHILGKTIRTTQRNNEKINNLNN
jgi:four helix bundle protein